jgi:2-keto-myo-inositol isomerase
MPDFLYGLNTSTIKPAGLIEKIRAAAAAGYDAIELWVVDVEAYVAEGGKLSDVRKALDDCGLQRPSMIYLKDWCAPDPAVRQKGLEEARRRLDTAAQLVAKRFVASPPLGDMDTTWVGRCYRELLELAAPYGVWPSFEYLGFVEKFKTIDTAWEVLQAANHPQATITHDAWHIFRGGGTADLLEDMPNERISIFHWDDAPGDIPREKQTDADRVMPGDGILDLRGLADQLRRKGWQGVLSLELFHEGYYRRDPTEVARLGLEKMKASVA